MYNAVRTSKSTSLSSSSTVLPNPKPVLYNNKMRAKVNIVGGSSLFSSLFSPQRTQRTQRIKRIKRVKRGKKVKRKTFYTFSKKHSNSLYQRMSEDVTSTISSVSSASSVVKTVVKIVNNDSH